MNRIPHQASLLERAAYAVLAAATGLGLLTAVVSAFIATTPEVLARNPVVARAACDANVDSSASAVSTAPSEEAVAFASR